MGISVNCKEKGFCCSYSGWNRLRVTIIEATLRYLRAKFVLDESTKNEEDEDHNYGYNKKEIEKFIDRINILLSTSTHKDGHVNIFIHIITEFPQYIDALIYFNVGGIYSLVNKSDCEGFYSPGNSLDIIILLDLIKPIINEYYNDEYSTIYEDIYDMFEESWKEKENIIIS